jgi:hypothetical protein
VNDDKLNVFNQVPPWIKYPNTEPTWGGWRQGTSEAWRHEIWLPFWRHLTPEQQQAYLEQYPPDEDWRLFLTEFWK